MRGINLPSDPKGKPVDIVRVPTPNSHHRPWNFHASVQRFQGADFGPFASLCHVCMHLLLNYLDWGFGVNNPHAESVKPGKCSSRPCLVPKKILTLPITSNFWI